ncbi:hypothetical protein C8F01DRAFT_510961 [Mycena amicta]|nr:hypothetical protein C8F01DRAFT_510961 [Mycena amicta]
MSSARDLRAECTHFRILVIGRANAGKTTILRKVCGAKADENPEIHTAGQDKGSTERGKHDIVDELIFKSNPQFIFHDSEGFESGSTSQVEKVKDFIKSKSEGRSLRDQLHAIWVCLPTETTRPLNGFEREFFSINIKGSVPVIAVFTKYDGLLTAMFNKLKNGGMDEREADDRSIQDAQMHLEHHFVAPLKQAKFPPSDYLDLSDMHEEDTCCDELIMKTTNALTNDALKLLLVSVQQNNVNLCTFYAVKWILRNGDSNTEFMEHILQWFPHVW